MKNSKKETPFSSNSSKIPRSQEEKSRKLHSSIRKVIREHRKKIENTPLAESLDVGPSIPKKVQEKMTAEDCCAILRGMAANAPERVVTRNYFRVHSGLKESVWQKFFGTFQEFKAQAGVTLTRGQRRLTLDVAKHASADVYRNLNEERRSYSTKYSRPVSGRWRTLLAVADLHDVECDMFALRVFLDTASRLQDIIDTVCINGDLFDLPEFGRYHVDPRNWDPVGRIKFVHDKVLSPLREVLPNAQVDLIEGNHEGRLCKHLADQTPALRAVLSDLHGMSVASLLGLDIYEINYIANADLAAVGWNKAAWNKELAKNWKVYYDCVLAHHFPQGRSKGLPGFHGHHHKHRVWTEESVEYGAYEWHQLGGLHRRWAEYTDGDKWNNGFSLVHVDTKTKDVQFEYVSVGQTFALSAGKFYTRKKNE
jgi:hypothetical protein